MTSFLIILTFSISIMLNFSNSAWANLSIKNQPPKLLVMTDTSSPEIDDVRNKNSMRNEKVKNIENIKNIEKFSENYCNFSLDPNKAKQEVTEQLLIWNEMNKKLTDKDAVTFDRNRIIISILEGLKPEFKIPLSNFIFICARNGSLVSLAQVQPKTNYLFIKYLVSIPPLSASVKGAGKAGIIGAIRKSINSGSHGVLKLSPLLSARSFYTYLGFVIDYKNSQELYLYLRERQAKYLLSQINKKKFEYNFSFISNAVHNIKEYLAERLEEHFDCTGYDNDIDGSVI